ncbi:50S ribosomal protein L31e [Candidatus Micrarchaeota archaeon]|nr:50S ribosomal protein L31e [Candidatus Micrarchaeota archaeon]
MAKLERIYTVPLGDAYETVRNKRTPRAVKILRAFIARHMKSEGARIILSEALNSRLWVRSIQKPPRRIKVRLVKDDGVVRAYLSDEKVEEPKKAAKKEEKKEAPKAEVKKEEKKAEGKPSAKPEARK